MDVGRVADDSGGYLCVSFLASGGAAGGAVAVCSGAGGFLLSDTDRVGPVADDAFDDALPGLWALPLADRASAAAVVAVAAVVVGRMAGFVGSRLGETLRFVVSAAPGRSLGGRAVGPAGLRSDRARVRDDMAWRLGWSQRGCRREAVGLDWGELSTSLLFTIGLGWVRAPWSGCHPPPPPLHESRCLLIKHVKWKKCVTILNKIADVR